MSNILITSDTHLDHDKIVRMSDRPWDTKDDMNEGIIKNINDACSPKDMLYIIGDFAFKRHAYWRSRIKCKVVLIRGNHDKMPKAAEAQFTDIVGESKRRHGILHMTIGSQQLVMSHYPLDSWSGSWGPSWHLHGHTHGRKAERTDLLRCDMGVDVWAYRPVPWEAVKAKMEARIPLVREARKARSADFDRRVKAAEALKKLREENAGFLRQVGAL